MDSSKIVLAITTILFACKGVTATTNQACHSGLKKCLTSFKRGLDQNQNSTHICRVAGVLVHCITSVDCGGLSTDDLTRTFNMVDKALSAKGLNCDEITKQKASFMREAKSRESLRTRVSNNDHRNSSPQKYAPEFSPQSPEFFQTTPKLSHTAAAGSYDKSNPSELTDPSDDDQDENAILGPTSSRRSRTLPRPVKWSNWGPQSQSRNHSGSFMYASCRVMVLRLGGFLLLAYIVFKKYLFDVL